MRKIDVLESIIQTEIEYVQLMKELNETKLEIFDVFPIEYRNAVEFFIGDMFGDVYAENVDTYDEVYAGAITESILRNDPTLDNPITKEEMVEILAILFQMEQYIHDKYMSFSNLGVEFTLFDQNDFNYKLIEKLLGDEEEVHHLREEYLNSDLTLDELKERIASTIKNN